MAKEMNCEDLWGKWLRSPALEPPKKGQWPKCHLKQAQKGPIHCRIAIFFPHVREPVDMVLIVQIVLYI